MRIFDIKSRIREAISEYESLDEKISRSKDASKDDERKDNINKRSGEGGKKDYSDVRRAFEKLGGPSMVDIMKIIGISDDEKGVNRSLFRKKVKQIKNKETGSYYQFSDEELNQVRGALEAKK